MTSLNEPENLEFVCTGDQWPYTFWQRNDEVSPIAGFKPEQRWWDCSQEDGGAGPETWEGVSSLPNPQHVQFAAIPEEASDV